MGKHRITQDWPHLEFDCSKPAKFWSNTFEMGKLLGECEGYVTALKRLPIPEEEQRQLRTISLNRGATATTAIEGNTLTVEEFEKMQEGRPLPTSRKYQAQEVMNVLELMTDIRNKVVFLNDHSLISVKLLMGWNKAIGKDLGALYDGVPGRIRNDSRHVGRYLAPPPEFVPELLEKFCEWMRAFGFASGQQTLSLAIQQAIAGHVFYEWIHPFADGNGRTGRMIEFYVLLRAGFPDIAVHVLANHYNNTRSEYSAHFDNARKERNITKFMMYSLHGLVDGLRDTLEKVQAIALTTTWKSHIYEKFKTYSSYNKITVFKRRRELALEIPISDEFVFADVISKNSRLLVEYMQKDNRMLDNDIQVLIDLNLVEVVVRKRKLCESKFKALYRSLFSRYLPMSVSRAI